LENEVLSRIKSWFAERWKTTFLSLVLASAFVFAVYAYWSLSITNSSSASKKSFSFIWGPEAQNITLGTLYLNMTFEIVNGNLSIVAKINDDEYGANPAFSQEFETWGKDGLDLVLDRNDNGKIDFGSSDKPYIFWDNNRTMAYDCILLGNKSLGIPKFPSALSPYHRCVFNEGTGYTFTISLPLQGLTSDIIHVIFIDFRNDVVYTQFHFGLELG